MLTTRSSTLRAGRLSRAGADRVEEGCGDLRFRRLLETPRAAWLAPDIAKMISPPALGRPLRIIVAAGPGTRDSVSHIVDRPGRGSGLFSRRRHVPPAPATTPCSSGQWSISHLGGPRPGRCSTRDQGPDPRAIKWRQLSSWTRRRCLLAHHNQPMPPFLRRPASSSFADVSGPRTADRRRRVWRTAICFIRPARPPADY